MTQLLERLLLFACCSFLAVSDSTPSNVILPILIVIIISSLAGYFESRNIRLGLLLVYLGLCVFRPEYLFFFPLLSYDFFCTNLSIYQLMIVIPFFYHQGNASISEWYILLLYLLLSFCLKSSSKKFIFLLQEFHTLQDETNEITESLHQKNHELMEKQLFEVRVATLDERNRIAREIHDNVGHQLSSSILQTGALLAVTQEESTREHLISLKDTLTASMDSIRHSIHEIHEDSLELENKIQELIQHFDFCPITFEYQIEHDFSIKMKYAIIFIIKEALSNIMKHSNATSCLISIYEHPAFYQILIHDNGTRKTSLTSGGIGITSMEERIESFHGKLHIHTDNGFKIFITIPKTGDDESETNHNR